MVMTTSILFLKFKSTLSTKESFKQDVLEIHKLLLKISLDNLEEVIAQYHVVRL